jgi:hypothetical protein
MNYNYTAPNGISYFEAEENNLRAEKSMFNGWVYIGFKSFSKQNFLCITKQKMYKNIQ